MGKRKERKQENQGEINIREREQQTKLNGKIAVYSIKFTFRLLLAQLKPCHVSFLLSTVEEEVIVVTTDSPPPQIFSPTIILLDFCWPLSRGVSGASPLPPCAICP